MSKTQDMSSCNQDGTVISWCIILVLGIIVYI